MGAYGDIDKAVNGGLYGLDKHIEGGWAAKEDIEFGKPVFGYVNDENGLYLYHADTGIIVFDGDFGAGNNIVITVNSVAAASVPFNTTHDLTAADVLTAVNALTGVVAVLDSADATNRTFLIQTKGTDAVVAEAITGGTPPTGAISYSSSQVFIGASMFSQNTAGLYSQYDAVNVVVEGQLWVTPVAAVDANQDAYVDNAAADIGEWTSQATGIAVNARFRSSASASSLARVEIAGKTDMTYAGYFV